MTTEIKEQPINKFELAIKIVKTIENVVLLLLLAYVIPIILYKFDIFVHQMPYKMFALLFPIHIGIAVCMFILCEILKLVKDEIEHENVDVYKNSTLNIILSDKDTISNIIFYIMCFTAEANIVWFLILLLLYIVVPSRLSKYFENKLIKQKEL